MTPKFTSRELSYNPDCIIQIEHNLNKVPTTYQVVLRCKKIDQNYPARAEIPVPASYATATKIVVGLNLKELTPENWVWVAYVWG